MKGNDEISLNVGKMTYQRNYRTGRIIVKISLLSAAAGTISHPFDTPPPLICAELSSVLTHLYFSINHLHRR